jgi:hypothetical protein
LKWYFVLGILLTWTPFTVSPPLWRTRSGGWFVKCDGNRARYQTTHHGVMASKNHRIHSSGAEKWNFLSLWKCFLSNLYHSKLDGTRVANWGIQNMLDPRCCKVKLPYVQVFFIGNATRG